MLHGVRFCSPDDRVTVAERVTEFAVSKSLQLTPPELYHVPEHFRRADGSSRLRPRTHVVYTTSAILEAEARLLEAARQVSGPRLGEAALSAAASANLPGRAHELGVDQRLAVEKIVTSGRVVDVLVGPAELLYVAATRGRETNRLYVDVAYDPDPATAHDGAMTPETAREVLARLLANEGAELSAHEALARAQRESDDLATLAAEYEAIARVAQQERWDALLDRCGLSPRAVEEVTRSDAYGPLVAALRRAEACGLDLESGLRELVAERPFVGVDDVAAVLHHRVESWVASAGSRRPDGADMVGSLIPRAVGVADPDLARALVEREQAMERYASSVGVNRRRDVPPADAIAEGKPVDADSTAAGLRGSAQDPRRRRRIAVGAERASRLTQAATVTTGRCGGSTHRGSRRRAVRAHGMPDATSRLDKGERSRGAERTGNPGHGDRPRDGRPTRPGGAPQGASGAPQGASARSARPGPAAKRDISGKTG